MKYKKKRSITLIISAGLAIAYSIYLMVYFGSSFSADSGVEAAGGVIASIFVTPHMLCVVIGAIFNSVACINNKRSFALVGLILYAAAAVIFLMYALFLVPSIILSIIGYVRLKKINQENVIAFTTAIEEDLE